MFRINVQKKENDSFVNVKNVTVEQFNETLAERANSYAKDNGLYCQLMISNSDPVPSGYNFRRLEYNTVIWKANVSTVDDALAVFTEPF